MSNNVNAVSAMEELFVLKKELTIELIRLEAVADIFDCEAAIKEAKESIAFLQQAIKEEMKLVDGNKKMMGAGRIVNGVMVFMTPNHGGVCKRVVKAKPAREVLVGEVLDVRYPTVQPMPAPIMGCDWVADERDYDAYDMLFGRNN